MFTLPIKKSADCQNTVYYKDMLWNKVYTLPPFRCILSLFFCPPFCQSIHIAAKEEHNHSSPAGQIHWKNDFSVCSAQSHTSRPQYDNLRVPENVSRFRSTIPLLANQSSCCAEEYPARIVPAQDGNSSWRRPNRLLFYFQPIHPPRAGIVPVQKPPLHIACDSTAPDQNSTDAGALNVLPCQGVCGKYSDSGLGLRT